MLTVYNQVEAEEPYVCWGCWPWEEDLLGKTQLAASRACVELHTPVAAATCQRELGNLTAGQEETGMAALRCLLQQG